MSTSQSKEPKGIHTCHYFICGGFVPCHFLLKSFCYLSWFTVKRAKVASDNSKGPKSALASSSQAQVGVSTPPSDLKMEEQEDEEDGRENSTTDVETDEEGMKLKNRVANCGFCTKAVGCVTYLSTYHPLATHPHISMVLCVEWYSLHPLMFVGSLSKFVVCLVIVGSLVAAYVLLIVAS